MAYRSDVITRRDTGEVFERRVVTCVAQRKSGVITYYRKRGWWLRNTEWYKGKFQLVFIRSIDRESAK